MGILNVTPDSFFDGGQFNNFNDAVARGLSIANEGADIIDIGGQSTRPGSESVTVEEEIERVIPVIKALSAKVEIPISIDTYRSEVAELALEAGASMVNDISALRFDDRMVDLVAEKKVALCLMHMKGTPKDMQRNPTYVDPVAEIKEFLSEKIDHAIRNGVKQDLIFVDPGIGFGKRLEDNYAIVRHIKDLKSLGMPLIVGASRKAMIGTTLELEPSDRLEGTIAVNVLAIAGGADVIRVHDVLQNVRAARMANSVLKGAIVER